jgi:hypothetical protein
MRAGHATNQADFAVHPADGTILHRKGDLASSMMKTLLTLFAGAALVSAAAPKTFTGVITDAMCGKDHAMMGVKPDSKCVLECVKSGSKYALIEGNNVYELSDQKAPEKFAGQKVKVTGTLNGNVLQVESIAAAK